MWSWVHHAQDQDLMASWAVIMLCGQCQEDHDFWQANLMCTWIGQYGQYLQRIRKLCAKRPFTTAPRIHFELQQNIRSPISITLNCMHMNKQSVNITEVKTCISSCTQPQDQNFRLRRLWRAWYVQCLQDQWPYVWTANKIKARYPLITIS